MRIRSVEFTGSFGYSDGFPADPCPEVALFGRSNVGKSSLINTLLGQAGVARISKSPGKTRAANYFKINGRFFLVDMPGYGFAKVPRSELRQWREMVERYLGEKGRRNALVQLIDARHDPTPQDLESIARMSATRRPLCLVFTKVDKVNRSSIDGRIAAAVVRFDVLPDTGVVAFSSVTGRGRRELWSWIESALSL